MATIRRRGKRWQAQVRKASADPVSATFETKAAAAAWARRIETDIDQGKAVGRTRAIGTIADLIDRYEIEMRKRRPWGRSKQGAIDQIRRALGPLPLRDLTTARIIDYGRDRHSAGAGPVTVSIDLTYLGSILRMAGALWRVSVTDQAVREAREALRYAGIVGKGRSRERRPSKGEIDRLCAHWESNPRQLIPMADIVRFAIASGMRQGEITRIVWADLDPAARIVIIRDRKDPRNKWGNDEKVPLLNVAGYDALDIILRQPRTSDRIFPYKEQSISTAFDRGCEALGIVNLTFHDLRHEAASRLFEAGLSIEQVALVTGHKDWRTLKRYTQLKPEDLIARVSARASSANQEKRPDDTGRPDHT